MARRPELDALRGIAALSVVMLHCLVVLPEMYVGGEPKPGSLLAWMKEPPLRTLWAGAEAVVFFFVLSGLVLSLPFYRGRVDTVSFMVKRVLRIYPPYAFAVLLSLIAFTLVPHMPNPATSGWFAQVWDAPLDLSLVLEHFALLPSFDHDVLNPVLWSLVIEMRISLAFPLLMWVVLRYDWKTVLFASVSVYVLGRGLQWAGAAKFEWSNDYGQTLMHVYQFTVGALLARHLDVLGTHFRRLGRARAIALFVAAIALYRYQDLLPDAWVSTATRALGQFPTTLGIAVIIVACCTFSRLQVLLSTRPLIFLGEISYSLYLLHAVVLVSVVHLLHTDTAPALPTYILVLVLSIVLAWLAWYLIERPSMALSRKLFRKKAHATPEIRSPVQLDSVAPRSD